MKKQIALLFMGLIFALGSTSFAGPPGITQKNVNEKITLKHSICQVITPAVTDQTTCITCFCDIGIPVTINKAVCKNVSVSDRWILKVRNGAMLPAEYINTSQAMPLDQNKIYSPPDQKQNQIIYTTDGSEYQSPGVNKRE